MNITSSTDRGELEEQGTTAETASRFTHRYRKVPEKEVRYMVSWKKVAGNSPLCHVGHEVMNHTIFRHEAYAGSVNGPWR